MPVYGDEARPLMQEFVKKCELEDALNKKLLGLMESGTASDNVLRELHQQIVDVHDEKMKLYADLNGMRLD